MFRILTIGAILLGMALLAPAAADASELAQRGGNHPGIHHGHPGHVGHVGHVGFRPGFGFRGFGPGFGLAPFLPPVAVIAPPVAVGVPVGVPVGVGVGAYGAGGYGFAGAPIAAAYGYAGAPVAYPAYAPPQVNYAPALPSAAPCGCPQ